MEEEIKKKICNKCIIEQDLSCFNKSSKAKDGHQPKCKICTSEYNKQRYSNNPDVVKERSKIWGKNNPEKVNKQRRDWSRETPVNTRGTGFPLFKIKRITRQVIKNGFNRKKIF